MTLRDLLGIATPVIETRPVADADGMIRLPPTWRISESPKQEQPPAETVPALLREQAA